MNKAVRTRRVPQRTCIACRSTAGKRELTRLVRTPEGRVAPDPTGKAPGRGAYLCEKSECWEAATKKKLLDRALRVTVSSRDAVEIAKFGQKITGHEVARVE